MKLICSFLCLLVTVARAEVEVTKHYEVFVKAANNTALLASGKPVIWGEKPGRSMSPDSYDHVLSDINSGKSITQWEVPIYGKSGVTTGTDYHVVTDLTGKTYGVLKLGYGGNRSEWRFEVYDFLTGQLLHPSEFLPLDSGYSVDWSHKVQDARYLTLSDGIHFVETRGSEQSDSQFVRITNILTGTQQTKLLVLSQPHNCVLANAMSTVVFCVQHLWQDSVKAIDFMTGQILWETKVPAGVEAGEADFEAVWTLPSGEAFALVEVEGAQNDFQYVVSARGVKPVVRPDGSLGTLPSNGLQTLHKEVGLKNLEPFILGYSRDDQASSSDFSPFTLNLVSGQLEVLPYVPWRAFSFVSGEMYALAPASDGKSFSIVNVASGNFETSFQAPYDHYRLWQESAAEFYERTTYDFLPAEGLLKTGDKFLFWARDPDSEDGPIGEMHFVELGLKAEPSPKR